MEKEEKEFINGKLQSDYAEAQEIVNEFLTKIKALQEKSKTKYGQITMSLKIPLDTFSEGNQPFIDPENGKLTKRYFLREIEIEAGRFFGNKTLEV